MKILWIVNLPFGPLMEMAGLKGDNASGSWLNAALLEFIGFPDVEICVATTWKTPKLLYEVHGNMSYCLLPGNVPCKYDVRSSNNEKAWKTLHERFAPDIIHLWGTEFRHGYHAMQVMKSVPSIIYIQGLLSSVARYYVAGMSVFEQVLCRGIQDIYKINPVRSAARIYQKKSVVENKMLALSKFFIIENNWCESHCKAVVHDCHVYKSKLPIKKEFFKAEWSPDQMVPFTLMCNTSGYPIKGLHILIKAMAIVVKSYPQVVLKIPGHGFLPPENFVSSLKVNGYCRLIKYLIKKHKLENNVRFLGVIPTSSEMAEEMARSNVFVMPSSIENHSSTLIEAMVVGVPCIASDVGGVLEIIQNGTTGLVYRFEEYELLAFYLCKLLGALDLATTLGKNARKRMLSERNTDGVSADFITIYRDLLSRKNGI